MQGRDAYGSCNNHHDVGIRRCSFVSWLPILYAGLVLDRCSAVAIILLRGPSLHVNPRSCFNFRIMAQRTIHRQVDSRLAPTDSRSYCHLRNRRKLMHCSPTGFLHFHSHHELYIVGNRRAICNEYSRSLYTSIDNLQSTPPSTF